MASPAVKRILLQRQRRPDITAFSLLADGVNTAGLVAGRNFPYIRDGIEYQGTVSVIDGKQYVVGLDIMSGAVVSRTQVCADYTAYKDNHNPCTSWLMPDGVTAVYLTAAHNIEAIIKLRRSTTGDPADLGSQSDLTAVDLVTYVTPQEHPNGSEAIFSYRGNEFKWYLASSGNNGASWTFYPHPFWTDPNQTYCHPVKIAANEYLYHAASNPTLAVPNIYSFRLNTSTGAIRNAAGTTIANFKTGVPAFSANIATADLFHSAPAGYSCNNGDAFEGGGLWFFSQGTGDGQFDEFWTARCTTANVWDPADYVFSKLCDGGYGVGSLTAPQWGYTPLIQEVEYPGVTRRMLAVSQILGGMNYAFIMEQQDDFTWKNVLAFNEAPQGTDHSEYIKWPLGQGQGKVVVAINPQDYSAFDTIVNATMEFLRVDALGAAAPTITVAPTLAIDEYQDLLLAITTDQPCGINIVGGADAANFEIVGGKYLRLIHAANYDAPHDADANNEFVVQVAARSFGNGLESAPFTFKLTIAPLVKTGGAQLFTQTADLTNAAWTPTGLGTRVNNSTDVLDADGGNTMDKLPQSATTSSHNITQTRTLTAGVQYFDAYKWHPDPEAPFITLRRTCGAAGSFVTTFDGRRGCFVASIGTLTPDRTFCIPLANGCFIIGHIFTAPVGAASGVGGPAVRQFSGPSTTEVGSTAAAAYINEPSHMVGKFKTHVPRTT